jgi:hypothetical protein
VRCHDFLVSRTRPDGWLEGHLRLWPAVYTDTYSNINGNANSDSNCNSNSHIDDHPAPADANT